jgi:hypothetical protein
LAIRPKSEHWDIADRTSSELQRKDVSVVTKVRPDVGTPDYDERLSASVVKRGVHSRRTVRGRGSPDDNEEFSLPAREHPGFDISSIYPRMNPVNNGESSCAFSFSSAAKDDVETGQ